MLSSMNTATAETESPAEIEFHKAEICRLKAEIERDLAEMEESQRRTEALGAITDARLDNIKRLIAKHHPTTNALA